MMVAVQRRDTGVGTGAGGGGHGICWEWELFPLYPDEYRRKPVFVSHAAA